MRVVKGIRGIKYTHQEEFPATAPCVCGGEARVAFVAKEEPDEDFYISSMYNNQDDGKFWPHDAVAVAIYFCEKCLKPVALSNQG